MALVTRLSTAGMDISTAQFAPQKTGLMAGEDLAAVAPCYIKSSDGKVYMANGTAAAEAAEYAGFTPRACKSGQPVTLFGYGTRFSYGSGLTPGDIYYLADDTAGGGAGLGKGKLQTTPSLGDAFGLAQAITANDIVIIATRPNPLPLDGGIAANVANANVVGGLPVVFRIDCADASGDVDVVTTHKIRVIDAWGLNTGIAAHASTDTWQVKNAANAISDAVAKTATVNAVKRIGTIDPTRAEIAAGGTLRITTAKTTNAAVTVYVLALRVP